MTCELHPTGHPTCHYPQGAYERRAPEAYRPPGLLAQVLDLKWEISFFLLILLGLIAYISLAR